MLEYLRHILSIFAIVSLPAYLLFTSMSFVFFGHSLIQYGKKTIWFSCCTAVYTNLFFFLPKPLYFINFTFAFFILFQLFFKKIPIQSRFIIAGFAFGLNMIVETFTGMVILLTGLFDTYSNHVVLIIGTWPTYVILAVLVYFMHQKHWSPGERILDYLNMHRHNNIGYLLIFLLFQIITLTFSIIIIYSIRDGFQPIHFMLYASLAAGFLIIFFTLKVIAQTKDQAIQLTQKMYIDNVHQMFSKIRGQRHDFLNHMQVISSFLKVGKVDEMKRYVEELTGDVSEINELIQIGHPALSALIQSKIVAMVDEKIDFQYEFTGMDQLSLGMKSIDIVKITGNLIDNAVDEVIKQPVDQRWIRIKGWIDKGVLFMKVNNPGRFIPEDELQHLFNSGYTTKNKATHSGLGLSIVKDRVDYYKGQINIESSSEQGIEFFIKIPLKLKLV